MKLRLTKCWQTPENDLVLEVKCSGELAGTPLPKKSFLALSPSRPEAPYLSILQQKPSAMSHKGVGTQLVRKHLTPGGILKLRESPNRKAFELTIGSSGELWRLIRLPTRPPELLIVGPEDLVMAKLTSKSQFTKRYPIPDEIKNEISQLEDVALEKLFAGLSPQTSEGSHTAETTTATDADANLETPLSPELRQIANKVRGRLKRRQKTLKKSLEKTLAGLPGDGDIAAAEAEASLLAANLHQVQQGMATIQLNDYEENQVSISLEEGLSPGKNLEKKYKFIRKMRGRLTHGSEQLQKLEADAEAVRAKLHELENAEIDTVKTYARELGLEVDLIQSPTKKDSSQTKLPYRQVTLAPGVVALVAKGAKDGDTLVKSAKSNDFWLHITGSEGAHIILPYRCIKAPRPAPEILKFACMLAVYNSKLRDNFSGEVYFSQKRHLRKAKGLKPGLWLVDRSETLFVKFDQEELNRLLASDKMSI